MTNVRLDNNKNQYLWGVKSYVILFVALTMLVKPLWPIADYIMNYDYIVNVLCENKDKPELQCDGKCYLAQMLAKEAKQDDNNPFGNEQSKTETQQLVFFQDLLSLDFRLGFYHKEQNNFNTSQDLFSTLFTVDIAQPPELT